MLTIFISSASRDGGASFSSPVKVNDDQMPAMHGMHSLAVGDNGHIFLAWLDERNLTRMPMKDMKMDAKSSGHHSESNRELFISSSTDGGKTFSPNARVCHGCLSLLQDEHDDRE